MEEGCHVLDAGEIATEVLYFLVGSRSLDGGAMITASHNPKAYTGVKLVREGALPLSGDAGIGDLRDMIADGPPREGPGRRHDRGRRRAQGVPGGSPGDDPRRAEREADEARRRRRQRDGRADGRPAAQAPEDEDHVELYFKPDGNFPDHEPNPLLEENRKLIIRDR